MEYSEDHIALAAEYAIGTLDADERAQVETMMSVDSEFTAIVRAWEYRLGVLNQMVGSVEPSPEVWDRIKTAVGWTGQPREPLVTPEKLAGTITTAGTLCQDAGSPRGGDASERFWRQRIAESWLASAASMRVCAGIQ